MLITDRIDGDLFLIFIIHGFFPNSSRLPLKSWKCKTLTVFVIFVHYFIHKIKALTAETFAVKSFMESDLFAILKL